MDYQALLSDVLDANHHKGGLKCRRLFRVEGEFFNRLRQEILALVEAQKPSRVAEKTHITNWTNPYGDALQYSLFNRSGSFNDTSADHDRSLEGKKFHHADTYPTIDEFIKAFPHAYNMRLNGMGPKGGLSPHEEHIVWPSPQQSSPRTFLMRGRFHLPIVTNDKVEMLLDEEIFHFEVGSIFFFNNGCIHSANNGGSEFRYHLVWDMFLTEQTLDLMFNETASPPVPFLETVVGDDRTVPATRQIDVKEYAIQGEGEKLYRQWQLQRLGIAPHTFHNWFNEWTYWRHSRLGKVDLVRL